MWTTEEDFHMTETKQGKAERPRRRTAWDERLDDADKRDHDNKLAAKANFNGRLPTADEQLGETGEDDVPGYSALPER